MQRIPIKLAKEGMVLAKDAVTPEGQVLCGADTPLSEELIARLRKQGVLVISVQGHPVRLPGEMSLAEKLKELDRRFSKVQGDPVLRALKHLIGEHLVIEEKGEEFLEKLKKEPK